MEIPAVLTRVLDQLRTGPTGMSVLAESMTGQLRLCLEGKEPEGEGVLLMALMKSLSVDLEPEPTGVRKIDRFNGEFDIDLGTIEAEMERRQRWSREEEADPLPASVRIDLPPPPAGEPGKERLPQFLEMGSMTQDPRIRASGHELRTLFRKVRRARAIDAATAAAMVEWLLPMVSEPLPIEPSSMSDPNPLIGPRIRSRKMLAPPPMQLLFDACGSDKESASFSPFIDGENGGLRYPKGTSYLQIQHPDPVPLDLRNASAAKEALEAWARAGVRRDLEQLDDMAWDVAALAVTSFYARTRGNTIDTRFPLMVDDYMEWRDVDPRKRTEEGRQDIVGRIKLLCSSRCEIFSETSLYLADRKTGRKKKESIVVKGPLLVRAGDLYRSAGGLLQREGADRPDGVLLSLGEWARKFVEEQAMLGVYMKRLAEYDLRREQWERRIGWYLCFQMQNQASKSGWAKAAQKGDARMLSPQHSLFLRTVLNGARLDWEPTARKDPGRIIRQILDALAVLQKDGILSDYRCLDGAPDGSDLPIRGRLDGMLSRRWVFLPGGDLAQHLYAKRRASDTQQSCRKRQQ